MDELWKLKYNILTFCSDWTDISIFTPYKMLPKLEYKTSTDMTTEDLLKLYHSLKCGETVVASEMLSITLALILHCL